MIRSKNLLVKCYIALIFILSCLTTIAQPFTAVTNPFPGLGRGAMAFVDFDNDGDLDLVMTGQDNAYNIVGKVFENNAGIFDDATSGIQGLYNSALSVADYDHDGLQDIIITGQGFNGNATYLYKNAGNMLFQLADSTLYAAGADGDVAFGDYDNDGYADIALSGNWKSELYKNNTDGTFSLVADAGLPDMNSSSICWGDYDNDGEKDLLMAGDDGSVIATIMQNNNSHFTRIELAGIEGAIGGSARFGDHDLDGYLDIMITGKDVNLSPVSFIYRNNADGTFSNAFAGFVGTALGPADWIDYDNDGDPDVMLSGQNAGCGNASTRLYTNNSIGGYEEYPAGFAFVERACSTWGDYDNDGDSDLLLAGISGSATRVLYRNDVMTAPFEQNTSPTVPSLTVPSVWDNIAVLNWDAASDTQTQSTAITYNVRVGTTPGGIDILSPEADPITGRLFIATHGNAASKTFLILTGLAPGTYYYSVQAVDQGFKSSGFSQEQSFVILPTNASEGIANDNDLQFHVKSNKLFINLQGENNQTPKYSGGLLQLFNSMGVLVKSVSLNAGQTTVDLSNLMTGVYIIKAESLSGVYHAKFYFSNP